jgi:F0F1-type ATP synthase membrane subunit a
LLLILLKRIAKVRLNFRFQNICEFIFSKILQLIENQIQNSKNNFERLLYRLFSGQLALLPERAIKPE